MPDVPTNNKYNFNREEAFSLIMTGMHQYFDGNPNLEFVVGLSGGIDSALVAFLAKEAFGKNRVHGLILPSNTTSEESVNLSLELANSLEIDAQGVAIGRLNDEFIENFERNLNCKLGATSKGNVAARLRMVSLMAASNEFGWCVLNTGNRTEAMLGYCTLYGDTVGAFSPIGDLFKTEVYLMAEYANLLTNSRDGRPAIPERICTRPATAELVAGQTDESDIGASYACIDRILWGTFVQDMSVEALSNFGFDAKIVQNIVERSKKNAFKTRYFAPHPIVHPEFH